MSDYMEIYTEDNTTEVESSLPPSQAWELFLTSTLNSIYIFAESLAKEQKRLPKYKDYDLQGMIELNIGMLSRQLVEEIDYSIMKGDGEDEDSEL